ncbi:MAG: tRNA (adenosine(37)-N6)-dimethylallyltransferase MiaA [Magnetococcales bacterium]|nr:tRNA (adenosine(37)-N6)-dimethylallyltransferase MiaA [Magnetococcales bacterium]
MEKDAGVNGTFEGALLVVLGATASGKTRLGVDLARSLDGEIISVDSRQVYRGLDLGTGKDLHEYGDIRHHLIDCVDPDDEFCVYDFQKMCYRAIGEIEARGKLPCLVGGSGLYLESVLLGYRMARVPENPGLRRELASWSDVALTQRLRQSQPRLHNTTDLTSRTRLIRAIEIAEAPRDTIRVPELTRPRMVVLGIHWPRPVLRERIRRRLDQRLEAGLIDEVRHLLDRGVHHERLESLGLEYRWVSRHLRGEMDDPALREGLARAIGQFAKRQETWFRRMERRGVAISWIEGGDRMSFQALRLCAGMGLSTKAEQ